jgi:hypothetical protein
MENMREYPTKGSPGKENQVDQCPQGVEPVLQGPLALRIIFRVKSFGFLSKVRGNKHFRRINYRTLPFEDTISITYFI